MINTLYVILACVCIVFIVLVTKTLHKRGKLKMPSLKVSLTPGKTYWWQSEIANTLGLVALATVFINVLCAKIGFLWWNNVYHHEAFWWLNMSLLLTVFLTTVAKKPVVKWFAAALSLLIVIGIWKIGHSTENHEPVIARYTIKSGEVSKIIAYDEIVSRDMVPVEVRFNKQNSLTEFGEWQKVESGIQFPYPVTFVQYRALTDTFTVQVRSVRTGS